MLALPSDELRLQTPRLDQGAFDGRTDGRAGLLRPFRTPRLGTWDVVKTERVGVAGVGDPNRLFARQQVVDEIAD